MNEVVLLTLLTALSIGAAISLAIGLYWFLLFLCSWSFRQRHDNQNNKQKQQNAMCGQDLPVLTTTSTKHIKSPLVQTMLARAKIRDDIPPIWAQIVINSQETLDNNMDNSPQNACSHDARIQIDPITPTRQHNTKREIQQQSQQYHTQQNQKNLPNTKLNSFHPQYNLNALSSDADINAVTLTTTANQSSVSSTPTRGRNQTSNNQNLPNQNIKSNFQAGEINNIEHETSTFHTPVSSTGSLKQQYPTHMTPLAKFNLEEKGMRYDDVNNYVDGQDLIVEIQSPIFLKM